MKKPFSAGYYSSYDRGLECLLEMWPEIRRRVPEATLDIYYGWGTFDDLNRKRPQLMKWKWQMIKKLHDLGDMGVTEHGRVSHEELAKVMKETKVWVYPTEFPEIHCITALKAQEAGCYPVVTKVAALAETVKTGSFVIHDDIYTNKKARAEFIDEAVKALKEDHKVLPVPNSDWSDVATKWSEVLSESR